jgi:hypothetical protein
MEYFTLTLCALLIAYSVRSYYQIKKLQQKIIEQDGAHKRALATAGNAITDTLKVAFEQLKKNNSDHSKINSKLTEYNSRIHSLEKNMNRSVKDGLKQKMNLQSTEENENK